MYVTYFGGDPKVPSVPVDNETKKIWSKYMPEEKILPFGSKDNFWVIKKIKKINYKKKLKKLIQFIGNGRNWTLCKKKLIKKKKIN
jgi:hypothetical protein